MMFRVILPELLLWYLVGLLSVKDQSPWVEEPVADGTWMWLTNDGWWMAADCVSGAERESSDGSASRHYETVPLGDWAQSDSTAFFYTAPRIDPNVHFFLQRRCCPRHEGQGLRGNCF